LNQKTNPSVVINIERQVMGKDSKMRFLPIGDPSLRSGDKIDGTCAISPQRGDLYWYPGWRADEERSSEESPQPGDRSILQPRNPEAVNIEKA